MSSSMRLRETYLNNTANVRSGELEAAFLNCEEKEDVWKLGLCYSVDGLLMTQESSTKIMMDMLSFVENEEEFFNYPWGRRSYERTFPSLNKDMMHQRENYLEKMKNNKKDKEAKYTVYGFSIALQYWAYEVIPKLTEPRQYWVEEEGVDGEEEEENKKEAAEATRAAEEASIFHATRNKVEEEPSTDMPQSHKFYLELKTDIAELKANQTELKANQVILNDKLDRLLKMMEEMKAHRQPTGSESEATQSDILPEGYQPGEDVVTSTPTKEHTPEEQQTPGVTELQVAEMATIKFGRKKRVGQRSKRLIDYTDPSNKKFKVNDPCKPNPFRKIDPIQLDTFRRWLAGLIDNRKPIQFPTGDASTGFFFHLQTLWKWLADKHIDAVFRLIRECLWLFPKTYRKKVAIADTVYIAYMNGRWDAFRRTSNKANHISSCGPSFSLSEAHYLQKLGLQFPLSLGDLPNFLLFFSN
ncbi:hypothetical protein PanWU01x14_342370 [Parasponia andersonii]|uniref:DUF1985 domain-containing protein n=1 Tax=Parasponia andersonii TaxID=3476 RepID=A0A2P5ADR1_PARAD|nr:hypothetical protein PanWU01x14_342370 [Parasponia andersonii]